mgnify:FL=1
MSYRPVKEKIAKVYMNECGQEKTYYVFPFISGESLINNADSEVVSAIRAKDSPFIVCHSGKERETETYRINAYFIVKIENEMVKVPEGIIGKYEPAENESEEDKEKRETAVKNYFEIR